MLVYACDQQGSDSAGVTVGGSIDATQTGTPDTDTETAERDPGLGDGPTAADLADPSLVAGPEQRNADGSAAGGVALPSPDDPAPPTTDPASTPPTDPPTAIDLLVDELTVPEPSSSTLDGCGDSLDFGGRNMIDGIDRTTWRMDGDGTGKTLVLQLEGTRRVLSVGLIPGFDAVDPCDGTDRFATNRRITDVTWEFDDGSRVEQRLIDVATVQRIDVDATTTRIKLHLDGVTANPEDDFTAVSELVVRGV